VSPGVSADDGLETAVLEIEQHAAEAGWDQPGRLFALVETARLAEREPRLAAGLGDAELTPVEQEGLAPGRPLEEQLAEISWPDSVHGCAALVERVILPPDVEARLPDDPEGAATFAAEHPDRQEVRIVAAAMRTGVRCGCGRTTRTSPCSPAPTWCRACWSWSTPPCMTGRTACPRAGTTYRRRPRRTRRDE
jgi:hypothetical protein